MFWVQVVPAGFFLLSLFLIPESPRFLMVKGSRDHAQAVLTRLFGPDEGRRTADEIARSLARDHHRPNFSDLRIAGSSRLRPIVWTGIGLAVFQQLVGINVVFYYGAVLWRQVGFSENDALKINVLTGALSVGACLAAIALIDRIGRRPLLLVGSAGMAVTLGLVGAAFATATQIQGQLHLSPAAGLLALVAANGFTVFFNFSWGPVMWVMLGEMFPNQIRGPALAIGGLAQWLANFLVSVSFPLMAAGLGLAVTYGAYALFAALSLIFVQRLVEETRGRELEAMTG